MTTDFPEILIITTSVDAASDAVIDSLVSQGATNFFRLNTEDFPLNAMASFEVRRDRKRNSWNRSTSLDRLRRVWLRRHRLPDLPAEIPPAHKEYALRESLWFLRGLIFELTEFLPHDAWMSHPLELSRAESKVFQLSVAANVGLRCPETLISNDPQEIRRFFELHAGDVIAKPVRMGYFDYGVEQRATYTTKITKSDLSDDAALTAAPVIYQQHIGKESDIRVTVVGEKLYAAAIDSQSVDSARVDWRRSDVELNHQHHQLPQEVANGCRALMSKLGIRFGAIDFVLAPSGEYVFLEVNPNGQWLWLEDKLGFRVADDIACWLRTGQVT
jgi:hypothetical protein